MFSGSSSYLGGQSGRPNPQQFGSSFNQPQQQQQQQQPPNAFVPQPTGFGGAPSPFQQGQYPMQSQPTGFQQQQIPQLQQQYTGFPGQQQGQFQTGAPPMPPMPQQQQQQQLPSAPVQQPQPTGFSQMAASFQSAPASAAKPKGRRGAKPASKIPSIRLSFITAKDQAQFETLFKSAVGDEQTLSGDKARDILMRSNLDGNALSQIW